MLLRDEVERSPAEVVVTDLAVGPCLLTQGLSRSVLYLDQPGLEPVLLAARARRGPLGRVGRLGRGPRPGGGQAGGREPRPSHGRTRGTSGSVRLAGRLPRAALSQRRQTRPSAFHGVLLEVSLPQIRARLGHDDRRSGR